MKQQGFSLMELLVSLAVIGVLTAITVVVINPAEFLKKDRDGQRIADLNSIYLALQMAHSSELSLGVCDGTKIYASLPSTSTLSNDNLPSGVSWVQASQGAVMRTDGTGWIPINFNSLGSLSLLSYLPLDPKNSFGDNLFYTYSCDSSGTYTLTAWFESKYYNLNGSDPQSKNDGGPDPYLYEIGSNLFTNPLKPVGSWSFDEGSGNAAYDISGNGTHLEVKNLVNWVDGKMGKAVEMDSSISNSCVNQDAGVYAGTLPTIISALPSSRFTLSWWNNLVSYDGASRIHLASMSVPGCGTCSMWNLTSVAWIQTAAGDNNSVGYSSLPSLNVWHQHSFVFDKPNLFAKLYVDAEVSGQSSLTAGGDYGTIQWIGVGIYHPGCVDSIPGEKIDQVILYNRALSSQELHRQYLLSQ
ncbi:MAG: LamG-like jellyroll fold domain-containing protein [bacterium]|nr:LamG-like jellyroll fold domain-containing protein [bacterium]